jgi:hypothetical protein
MDNNRSSNDEALNPQTAPVNMDFGQMFDAAEQLQSTVSRFAEGDDSGQEGLLAVMKQMGAQLRTTDAKVRENRAQIEKLGSWIRNSRS